MRNRSTKVTSATPHETCNLAERAKRRAEPCKQSMKPPRAAVFFATRGLTRRWWNYRRFEFDLYISPLVVDESAAIDSAAAIERLELLDGLPLIDTTPEVDRLANVLLANHLLPKKAAADAQHVATATVGQVDYLLTWNCRHIANADKLPSIYNTLRNEGHVPPLIVTPDEFSEDA